MTHEALMSLDAEAKEVVSMTSRTHRSGCREGVRAVAFALPLLLLIAGCSTPDTRQPMGEDRIVRRVAEARTPRPSDAPITLAEATARLRRNNPKIREARAAYRSARLAASVRTPRPNPSVDLGPLLIGAPDILSGLKLGVDLVYGWTVPLTGRLRMQDELNAVLASAALVEAAGVERKEYLALRGELMAVTLRGDAMSASADLVAAAETSVTAARTAVAAGAATSLDVRLLELEAAGLRAETLEAEAERIRAAHAVAQRMGMSVSDAAGLHVAELPNLPAAPPSLDELKRLTVEHHPRLASIRAAYRVAEKELRLEMARKYPDLGVGLGFEDEGEEQKLSLPLGIEIPLYDRNQQGIARAYARRCQLRDEFASALTEILGRIEASRADIDLAARRLNLITAQQEPAEATNRLAEQMRDEAGGLDMLRVLEVFRSTRRVRLQIAQARLSAYEAWSSLEEACGSPLLLFAAAP